MLKRIVLVALLLVSGFIQSQNQKVADSLKLIFDSTQLEGLERLELLSNLAFNEQNNLASRLAYANELIEYSIQQNDSSFLFAGFLQKGNTYQDLEESSKALEAYLTAEKLGKLLDNNLSVGSIYMSIANTYSKIGDVENTEKYYRRGIKLLDTPEYLRTADDSTEFGKILFNIADEYVKSGDLLRATKYLDKADIIFRATNFELGSVYALGTRGQLQGLQNNNVAAIENLESAVAALLILEDYEASAEYLACLASISLKQNNIAAARTYGKRSLDLAQSKDYKKQISETSLILSKIESTVGNEFEAMKHEVNYYKYKDTVSGAEKRDEIASLMQRHQTLQEKSEQEILKKENEVVSLKNESQKKTIWGTLLIIVLIGSLAYTLYRRYGFVKKTNVIISEERDKSDHLLRNILPEETAKELKTHGAVKAQRFESVTVMFTDFKGFTSYAEKLSPEELVASVDYYFSAFDKIIEKHELEKIKTVGDAYMCAGGIPFPTEDHPIKAIHAAKEIIDFVHNSKKNNEKRAPFDVRVGINTGPVVAGVVGTKKFAYDIWGDTVNIASRMESNSEVGKINVSGNTYELIKDQYQCEYRGNIAVKNRGNMDMYFVGTEVSVIAS